MKRLDQFDNVHTKNFDKRIGKSVVNLAVLLNFNVSEVILRQLLNQQLFNIKVSLSAHLPFSSSVLRVLFSLQHLPVVQYTTKIELESFTDC